MVFSSSMVHAGRQLPQITNVIGGPFTPIVTVVVRPFARSPRSRHRKRRIERSCSKGSLDTRIAFGPIVATKCESTEPLAHAVEHASVLCLSAFFRTLRLTSALEVVVLGAWLKRD